MSTIHLPTFRLLRAGSVLGLAVALLLPACGGGSASSGHASASAPAAGAQGAQACTVFQQQDADTLLGGPAVIDDRSAGDIGNADSGSQCHYKATGTPSDIAYVKILHFSSPAAARGAFTQAKTLYPQDVAGVGDAAEYGSAAPLGALIVLRGSLTLEVGTTRNGATLDTLSQLARTLLGRVQ
jgi:hypothetical protein